MKNFYFVFLLSILIISCGPSSSSVEVNLEVSNAKEVNNINDVANKYPLNIKKSKLSWIGSKPAGKHNGIIPIETGYIAIDRNEIIGAKIILDIERITSIDLIDDSERHDRLVNHLKSDDFFDAENYPKAVFELSSITNYSPDISIEITNEFESDFKPASSSEFIVDSPTHNITGNLTMRDTTLSITFPASIAIDSFQIRAIAKFNINRTHWNLHYRDEATVADKTKDRFIYNTVNVGFDVVAEIKD